MLSENSQIFSNADPYSVSDYVNQYIGTHEINLPRKRAAEASLSHRSFGSLDLCRISYGSNVSVTSSGLNTCYHLQVLLKGHCLWRGHGNEHYFAPGELLLINPDDPADLTYSNDCEKFIVKLPVTALERVCSDNHWNKPIEGIRFSPRHSLQQLNGFSSLLNLVCDESERVHAPSRLREYFTGIIATKLLELLDNNIECEPFEESGSPFERVVQFIEENLKKNISLDQMAAVARMSPRSLYNLFEKRANTTPMNYIRRLKLERIHTYLSDPESKIRSITEVALDYGFLHLGRFAENYRNAFGELPSDTLRQHANLNYRR
ncbi:AraC-type DNA-binding protein [Geopseudomonas sagittaria]|uniref:AraC-type DNA-binding protein n=1 Tax=Geopseudomonas sagittaria TaxID=1135990 RepID=A0A1I5YTL2_9GAMM|nr:AraC family transcriptional regulator [Pseudomonas sagittaria]SFQ47603.1 AraC-type DNA-binding protein [Pseudomonas sagittaria]